MEPGTSEGQFRVLEGQTRHPGAYSERYAQMWCSGHGVSHPGQRPHGLRDTKMPTALDSSALDPSTGGI